MDAAEGSRGVPFHGHNEADAAVKAPRQAYENTCTRCLGDAVKAMLCSAEGNTNKPIVVIVRQIHDWSKRYNDVKNKDLKNICNPLVWKITDAGLHYKESYTNQEWLGAGGIPEGRAINLFQADSKLSDSPAAVPRYSNPFSSSAVESTKTAIKYIENIDPASAAKLKSVLASGADDASIGLTFVRQFEDGKVGFAGSLATSNGGSVPVRVLSGLPTPLWWPRGSSAAPAPSPASTPAAFVVTDEPQSVARQPRRLKERKKPSTPWTCGCGKNYLHGRDSKRAITHLSKCVAPEILPASAPTKQIAKEAGDDEGDDEGDEEEGDEDDENEESNDKRDSGSDGSGAECLAVSTSDEESVTASEVEGDAESDGEAEAAKKAARPKRKRAGSADGSASVGKSRKKSGSPREANSSTAGRKGRGTVQLQPVQVEKEYWGPPKPHKHALTQNLYQVQFNDGSRQVVLAEDTIDSKTVVVENLPSYHEVIRQWREQHPAPPPKPMSEGKEPASSAKRGRPPRKQKN